MKRSCAPSLCGGGGSSKAVRLQPAFRLASALISETAPPASPASSACARPLPTTAVGVVEAAENSSCTASATLADVDVAAPRYFTVLWAKCSGRKHKKWEGDGIMRCEHRTATLLDAADGTLIARASGLQLTVLRALDCGARLVVSDKEVEVQDAMASAEVDAFHARVVDCAAESPPLVVAVVEATAPTTCKAFVMPLKEWNGGGTARSATTPRHSVHVDGALVMPRPPEWHRRRYNKHDLPVTDVVVDPRLCKQLRPHQREGVEFLYRCVTGMNKDAECGAILADEMGLGKSLQCIALIWTLLKQTPYGGANRPLFRRVLLVCPCSLVQNWVAEFRKWLGDERLKFQPFALSKAQDVRAYDQSVRLRPVLIISYDMVVRCADQLQLLPKFELLVCDEGHRLKNAAVKTRQCLSALDIDRRVLLSGTPVQNDLQEFFSLVDFVNPGLLGAAADFRRRFEEPIDGGRLPEAKAADREKAAELVEQLQRVTTCCLLRRTAQLNAAYLPAKIEYIIFCRPTSSQLELYTSVLSGGAVGRGGDHLACLTALRKLCTHPSLLAKEEDSATKVHDEAPSKAEVSQLGCVDESGKLRVLCDLLAAIRRGDEHEKVVVVSSFTKTLDLIGGLCHALHYQTMRLDGQTPSVNRHTIVKQFNSDADSTFVFLLSSKAGGVGLNLIGASRMVLVDVDWNPANDLQAMARVWRDGQRAVCHIYRLITTGTIEEKMLQRQMKKQSLSGSVVDLAAEGAAHPVSSPASIGSVFGSNTSFTEAELRDLFSLPGETACQTHELMRCDCGGCGERVHCSSTDAEQATLADLFRWRHVAPSAVACLHADSRLESIFAAGNSFAPSFIFYNTSSPDDQP